MIASLIVERILSGDLKIIDPISQGGKITEPNDRLDETLKPLKSIATDLIVKEFFATAGPLISFLKLVHSMFQEGLSTFRRMTGIKKSQLFFLFKGGNILRIAAHDFLSSLPAMAKKEIEDFYAPIFKRSDNDFGIYLDPAIPDYELRFSQLTTMSYYIQDQIRDIMVTDPSTYFDFSRYSSEFKKEVLQAWAPKFSEVAGQKFDNVNLVEATPDLSIAYTDDQKLAMLKLKDSGTTFRITHNNALDFGSSEDDSQRSNFNLTRTKIHFILSSKTHRRRISGELVDVSIGYKNDTVTQEIFEHPEGAVSTYNLNHQESNLEIKFDSYSLHHIAKDLEGILFRQFGSYPWDDSKYFKRINRLMYVYFIDIFINRDNNHDRLRTLEDINIMILTPIVSGTKIKTQKFINSNSNLLCANLVSRMLKLKRAVDTSPDDYAKLIEMVKLMQVNLDFQTKTLSKVKEYCSTDGSLRESDVYAGNIKTFV